MLVRLTGRGRGAVQEIWGPIADDARAELARFSVAELGLIETFLRRALHNQARHAGRLRAGGEEPGRIG